MCWALQENWISCNYIEVLKDIYRGAVMRVRIIGGKQVYSGYSGFTLMLKVKLYLFALVMDELSKNVHYEIS